jgi:hypothetical protein
MASGWGVPDMITGKNVGIDVINRVGVLRAVVAARHAPLRPK